MNSIAAPKIGLLGAGSIAKFHIDALREVGFQVTDIASSPNSKNVEFFASQNDIPKIWPDPLKLIEKANIDALVIATNVEPMINFLELGINIGLPILIEKPVVFNYKDLIPYTGTSSRVMVGYNRRFYTNIIELKSILEETNPCIVNVEIPERICSDLTKEFGKLHNLYYVSVHVIDTLRFLFGKLEIKYLASISAKNIGSHVILESSSGFLIHISVNLSASANYSICVDASDVRYLIKPLETLSIYSGLEIHEPTALNPIRSYHPKLIKEIFNDNTNSTFKPGFLPQAREFRNLVEGNPVSEYATISDALSALEIIDAISHSLAFNS